MNHRTIARLVGGLLCALVLADAAQAALEPNALFTDNAVLQQKVKVPVWGTTDQADKVTVSIAGQEVSATPKDGRWRVDLAPLAAGGPHTLSIAQGSQKVELKNILVGEVWICGGQSNMQWTLKQSDGGSDAIAKSANDKIRLFTVPRKGSDKPETNVVGNWSVAGPETTGDFSGVGYFFGRDLQKQLDVPVGLIASNVGGTAAEQWMSKESIESNADLKDMSKPQGASMLYNSMIAPLAPYAIAGATWYQGESNAGRAFQYRKLLPAMIKNWRETFAQGDFPFLIVQIAPYQAIVNEPSDSVWAEIRDAQLNVSQNVPKTSLVVTTDVGDERDIHPRRKEPIGQRLALAARAVAYGQTDRALNPAVRELDGSRRQSRIALHPLGRRLAGQGWTLDRIHRRRRGPEVLQRNRQDRRRHGRRVERPGGHARLGPLWLGRLSGGELVEQGRPAGFAVPHRQAADHDAE